MTHIDISRFHRDGFLHVPGVVGTKELTALRKTVDRLIARRRVLPTQWQEDFKYGAVIDGDIENGTDLCRIEYMLQKDVRYLKLLGHPVIIELASRLHGRPFVLTWEDLIIKLPKRGIAVPPHQDLLYQSFGAPVFSIGIYLDDSGDSPLQVIPGSQRLGPLDREALGRVSRDREHEYVTLPVRAGDLLVHNVLLIHRSPPNTSDAFRRTLYFEFRSIESAIGDSPWSASWVWKRMNYVAVAVQRRRKTANLSLEDKRFRNVDIDRHHAYWRFEHPLPPSGDINLRVDHDDILRKRACDRGL